MNGQHATLSDWRIPIHTSATDPKGGKYGVWASGPNYKVSFHDGFTFYPVLGAAHSEHLPLHWQTRSVRVGSEYLVDRREGGGERPVHHHTDWRYEYRFGQMTEAYDVGPDGVEQTFVLPHRPHGNGDLIVEGVATTPLTAKHLAGRHGDLVFHDASGTPIVRYGAAFAIDANGRKTPIPTRFDGECITLEVPEAWLADAQFPVTIDPLTRSLVLVSTGTVEADICRNDELDRLLITFTRRATATDLDTHASVYTTTYRLLGLLLADITASWATNRAYCAYNGAADRYAIALWRSSATWSGVRIYHDDHRSVVPGSGTFLYVTAPLGHQDSTPTIGGTGGNVPGNYVYLAWRRDRTSRPSNTLNSAVWGCPVDMRGNGTLGPPRALSALTNHDQDAPSINRRALAGDWVIVWQQRFQGSPSAEFKIVAARVSSRGVHRGYGSFGTLGSAYHKVTPRIEGALGRWLCLFDQYSQSRPADRATYTQRGDWDGIGTMRTQPIRRMPRASYTGRNLAYDNDTDSHWTAVLKTGDDLHVSRFGFRGYRISGSTEVILTSSTWHAAAITYNDRQNRYHIVHFPPLYGGQARGLDLTMPDAKCRPLGRACAGTTGCVNRGGYLGELPYLGSEYFGIHLKNAIRSNPYVLMISVGVTSTGTPIGIPGCELWLRSPMGNLQAITTDPSGTATVWGKLLEFPSFTLGCQWLTIDNGLIKASNALDIVAR